MENEKADSEANEGVTSIETMLQVVEGLKTLDQARITDLAEETGLSKGAVYKHLITLTQNGFAVKEDNLYRLGFRFLDIGGYTRSNFRDSMLIKSKVKKLAHNTGEVAFFSIKENYRTVILYREISDEGVFTRARVGKRLPLHQTAAGKAILANIPRSEVEEIIDTVGLPGVTDKTITDRGNLFEELQEIQDKSYSISQGESTDGLRAIGAPVMPEDEVLGACAIAGPRYRLNNDRLTEEIPQFLLSIVNELELNMAHS